MFQKQKIEIENLLPVNESGSANNSFSTIEFDDKKQADDCFERLKEKLIAVSRWSEYAGGENFVFELTDSGGSLKNDPPLLQDKIRIQLPGPKDDEGFGYDWVEVVRMDDGSSRDVNFYLLEVSPCDCPYQPGHKTAHFYWENSTNTFIIAKQGNTIQFSIHGRNEAPNTEDQSLVDKIRNFIVANTGIIGGSRIQWEIFTDNLIKGENE